jgi:hypothetical protein
MKSAIFWDLTPCSSVEVDWHFGGTHCFHLEGGRVSQQQAQKINKIECSNFQMMI